MARTSKHQDLEKFFSVLCADSVFITGLEQNLLPDDADNCHKQLVPLQLTWAVHSYKKKEKGDQSTIHLAKHSVVRDLGLQDAAVPLAQMVGHNPDIAVVCHDHYIDTDCNMPSVVVHHRPVIASNFCQLDADSPSNKLEAS
ncbi:hypothetical protein BKA82DRAFT_11249 [Pisolithus tinctorius]|nr:hypothetical protein BKA82DRAFT_11249 [Pisolithus tinctorius]